MNRREFIEVTAAGWAGASLGTPGRAAPLQVGSEIDAFYDRSVVVDSLAIEDWDEAGFAAWKKSGYTAIQTSLSNRNLQVATSALDRWRQRFSNHADRLIHCKKAADIEQAKREGKLAVILGFQNAAIIEDQVSNLDGLYAAGTRCIQLTYNSRNLLGDGCTERTNSGLSDFGISCVEKMNDLGIIVDLSHCGEQTSADGITYSRRPPAFTHTMCKVLHFHPRAKSDELLRAISGRGGMTGLVTLGYFVSPDPAATIRDYIRHIDHAVKVCGIDHVGLCTDYQIRGIEASATRENWYVPRLSIFKPSYKVRWPPWIPELDTPDRFRIVTHALYRKGYKSSEIEKLLGLNWLRYFREIFGG